MSRRHGGAFFMGQNQFFSASCAPTNIGIGAGILALVPGIVVLS